MAGLNENLESANDNNRPQKKSMSSSTFLRHFVSDYVEKRPSAVVKNELIEEAMSKDTLSGSKVALALAEFRASDEKYSDVDISGEAIDVFMIRKHLAKGFVQLGRARQDIEQKILKEYEVTPEIFNSKLKTPLKGQSLSDLLGYIKSEYKLATFLKNNLGTEVKSRVKFDMLAGISEKQMQNRVRAMGDDERNEVTPVLLKIQNGGSPRDDEIRTIVESSLFDETQKVRFVHQFLPYITLQQALDIQLISEKKAESIKEQYIKDAIIDTTLSSDNLVHLGENISLSDIQVATKDIVTNAAESVKISEGVGFAGFESDVRAQREEALEELRKNGPKTFEALKVALSTLGDKRVSHSEIFSPGNFAAFRKTVSGETETHYIKIGETDDTKMQFSYRGLGKDTINLGVNSDYENIRYEDFFSNLQGDPSTSLDIMTQDTINRKIESKEIISSELQTYSPEYFLGTHADERKKDIEEKEIRSIQTELSHAESLLAKEDTPLNRKTVKSLQDDLKKVQEGLSIDSLVYIANKISLLEKLNEIDPEGSLIGLGTAGQKVSFYTGKDTTRNTFTVQSVDYEAWTITLNSRAGLEKDMSLETFYEAFKKQKPKRVKSIQTEIELVKGFGENFVFEDGEIKEKDAELNGEKKDRSVEYLKNDKEKLLKILSISNGQVEFQEGEIHEVKDDHHGHGGNHGHGKKEIKYNLSIKGAPVQKWTFDEFHRFIQEDKYAADWKIGQSYTERPLDPKNPTTGSFVQKFMKGLSIYEIIHGGKMVIEGITETLNHGSHAKSAHAALAMANWLPEELRDEMFMKVESAEAEETDKAKKKLGSIDSWMAVERIEKWLLNRDTPQYKLEAGALFMMEKYGHLTAKQSGEGKKGLYQYRGKFLWYERLGGRIGDDLYVRMKKQAEDEGQSFSEEKLVHFLLKQQCNSERHHYSGIHRRSRVHKEFENAWKSGVSAEMEKGEKDADSYRGSTTMAKEGMGEIKGGTTSNGLMGWAHRAATKGTAKNIKDYMLIPSAVLLSGACFDIDQTTYTKVKSFWDEGIPVIGFRMFGNVGLMNLYRDTVKDLAWEIQQAYPEKYPHIYEKAQKIHKNGKERNGTELSRLSEAEEFWNDYGEVLTRSLHMNLAGDSAKDSAFTKTDSIIKRKRNENNTFKQYYELVSAATGEGDAFKKEFVEDWVGDTGFFGLNINELTKKYLQLDQGGGFRMGSAAEKVWEQIKNDINATPNKLLVNTGSVSDELNRREQKRYLVEILQEFISAYMKLHGGNESALRALSRQTSSVGSQLKAWGIDVTADLSNYSPDDILKGNSGAGKYIETIAENIISGKTMDSLEFMETPSVLQVKKNTQTGIAANLGGNPNNERYAA